VIALCKPEDRQLVLGAAHQALATAREAGLAVDPVVVRERDAEESEWRDVWKQFFRATRIGRRFLVRPSWDPVCPEETEFAIDLDPGRAFGTGAHPSTRLAIGLCEDVRDARSTLGRFLDLGCGSGILSIAAARLWPEAIGVAVDNDPEATACSLENFERNRVASISLLTGTLDRTDGVFDLIVANIQADVLCELAAPMVEKLTPHGNAILSGILCEQVEGVLGVFEQAGFVLRTRRDEGEWSGLLLERAAATS
jgi:ribosomal protein L11 methyltransferase